jgi:hypothetical protein
LSNRNTLVAGIVIITFLLYGCSTQPASNSNISNTVLVSTQSRVQAPSSQYIDAIQNFIGGSSVSNIQLHYIRALDSTHSICLFTFKQGEQTLFNEACLAKENGKWNIYFASHAESIINSMPVYNMSLSASFGKPSKPKLVGGSEFFMVGGIIHDPAVASVALVKPSGELFRKLKIIYSGSIRLYAYGQLVGEGKPTVWTVRAYDKYGSVINLSNT